MDWRDGLDGRPWATPDRRLHPRTHGCRAGSRHARVERIVASRAERQRLLDRPHAPRVSFVLDESVLLRPIGGAAVLRAQLDHVLEVARSPRVEVRVLPLELGAHAGLRGSFVLLRFPGTADPRRRLRGEPASVTRSSRTRSRSRTISRVFDELRQVGSDADELAVVAARVLRGLCSRWVIGFSPGLAASPAGAAYLLMEKVNRPPLRGEPAVTDNCSAPATWRKSSKSGFGGCVEVALVRQPHFVILAG